MSKLLENNVVPLFPERTEIFDNLICECGNDKFFISVNLKAVCVDCRAWIDKYIDLSGEHQ